MGRKTAGGYYAVGKGRQIGIFTSWAECETQVKGYPDAKFKKFGTELEAQEFINQWSQSSSKPTSTFTQHSRFPSTVSTSTTATGQNPPLKNTMNSLQTIIGASKRRLNSDRKGTQYLDTPPPKYNTKRVRVDSPQVNKGIISADGGKIFLPFIVDDEQFVNVYTDGACLSNGRSNPKAGVGVWFGDDHPLNISKPVDGPPTNNTAEIQAARLAIETAKKAGFERLKINTDSAFLINCVTEWLPKWKSNGWKLAAGGDVKNRIELQKLDESQRGLIVQWCKVPAHAGVHGNEMADKLANNGALMY